MTEPPDFERQRTMTEECSLTTLDTLKAHMIARGYRVEISADGREERLIRPDGSVAVIARRAV